MKRKIILLFTIMTSVASDWAATFVVTNTNDSGSGSLREKIDSANITLGSDMVDATQISGTIVLASALPSITEDLTILGNSAAPFTIDGNNIFRTFPLAMPVGLTVTAKNMNLINGRGTLGGHIAIGSCNLNLVNCDISGGVATSLTSGGGAIYFSYGTLNLNRCDIHDNAAPGGAGVSINNSTAAFTKCSFIDNTGTLSAFDGGAIKCSSTTLDLKRCKFIRNSSGYGGAIRVINNSNLTLQGCLLDSNIAQRSGGGISARTNAQVQISNSIISNNRAAGGDGGGMEYRPNIGFTIPLIIENTDFYQNTSDGAGGGIFSSGRVEVRKSGILNNATTNPSSGAGGGIFCGNQLMIENSKILGNSSLNYGGGISTDGQTEIIGSLIDSNSVQSFGGGIYAQSEITISNSTFSNNSAGDGGGLTIWANNSHNITNVTFSGNQANNGGGLASVSDGTANSRDTIQIWNCTFFNNTASSEGGGIHAMPNQIINLNNSIVTGNITSNISPDINGAIRSSEGYNLIGSLNNVSFTGSVVGNIYNISAGNVLNPILVNNGGNTPTHALLLNSSAKDAGTFQGAPLTDQRGRSRFCQVDMGAYELNGGLNLNLGNDSILCNNQTLLLDATIPGSSYLWQDGSTAATFLASASGLYWVEITSGSCIFRDSVTVHAYQAPAVRLSSTRLCQGGTHLLDASTPSSSYLWQDGSTDSIYTVTSPGLYSVTVINACGSASDIVQIIGVPNTIDAGQDRDICKGSTIQVLATPNASNSTYSWSTTPPAPFGSTIGTTNPLCYKPDESGYVYVSVYNRATGCTTYDSLYVNVRKKCRDYTVDLGCGSVSNMRAKNGQFVLSQNPDRVEMTTYPNPSSGAVTISLVSGTKEAANLSIYDQLGKMVYAEKMQLNEGETLHELHLDALHSGSYIIRIAAEGKVVTQPLLLVD